jgi:hypothetical protein
MYLIYIIDQIQYISYLINLKGELFFYKKDGGVLNFYH